MAWCWKERKNKDVIFLYISVGLPSLNKTSLPKPLFKAMSCPLLASFMGPFHPSLSSLAWKHLLLYEALDRYGPRGLGDTTAFSIPVIIPHSLSSHGRQTSTEHPAFSVMLACAEVDRDEIPAPLASLSVPLCHSLIINHIPQLAIGICLACPAEPSSQTTSYRS